MNVADRPYRLSFPVALALAWVGVAPWLLYGLGVTVAWPAIPHSIVMAQGFVGTAAAGFLLTMLPRRTASAPPSAGLAVACAVLPALTSFAALAGWPAASQLPWLAFLATLFRFSSRRLWTARAARRAPDAFIWIPLALLMALAGTVCFALYGALHLDFRWHRLAQLLSVQGLVFGLVIGVGSLALPLMTRGEGPPDAAQGRIGPRLAHVACAIALVASFVIEAFVLPRAGQGLRGALLLGVLLGTARIHRRPTRPGLVRRLMHVAGWLLPLGLLAAAIDPSRANVFSHATYLAGAGLLVLAVAANVALGHGPTPSRADAAPTAAWLLGALCLAAFVARALAFVDGTHLREWLAIAASLFLAATLAWLWLCASSLRGAAPRSSAQAAGPPGHSR
ncbi:MAG: NnrS family protein [Planctomycetes bacterium]|nr:NnrS family protein [Planctomycetota bacterium]